MFHLRHLFRLTITAACVAACAGARTPAPAEAPAPTRESAARDNASPNGTSSTPIPAPVSDSVQESIRLAMRTVELFGDSANATPAPSTLPSAATSSAPAEEASWDIEVRSFVTRDRVDRYVKLFTGSARDRFVSWLQRGRRYEPMIRSTFRARGIPEDMYYLGAVESGYDPHAVSRAYAVGIWQFMTSTARGFGLRVDWWIDERRDPVKSTNAAARFLAALKDQFGSFYLAAAAYNGGPGRVKRGLARYADNLDETSGEDCFFALVETGALRSETVNYVPQLIAAAYIAKDAQQFGVTLDGSMPPYTYDSVSVGPNTPLSTVAKAAGASLAEVRDLNPFVLRGVTPPEGTVFIRVPSGRAAATDSVLASMPGEERQAYRSYSTRKGDSMASVANKFGISAHQLAWYNKKTKTGRRGALTAGQTLKIPTLDVVAAAFDVPDPAIEKYGRTVRGARAHVVKRGESLGTIARQYGTSVASLVRLNHLKKQVIYPGQSIIVSGGSSSRRASGSTKSPAKAGARTKVARATSGGEVASRKTSNSNVSPTAKKKAASSRTAASLKP